MRGALFALTLCALAAGGGTFIRSQALSTRDVAVLTPQIGALAADWEAKKTPENGRSVTFLITDVGAAFNPFDAAAADAGSPDAISDWVGRSLIGGDAAVEADTPLIRAFADSRQAARWIHKRYSAVGEKAMSREVEKAILRAHDAGAEINIVAQGADAAPVLSALRRLQGVERGGQKVGANKVILLGVNAGSFKRGRVLAGFDPAKVANVLELAAVSASKERPDSIQMDLYGGKRAGTSVRLEAVWPAVGVSGHVIENTSKQLRECLESAQSLDELLTRQEAVQQVVNAKKAEEDAVKAQAAAVVAAKEQARVQVQAQAQAQAQAAARAAAPELAGFKPDPSAALPGAPKPANAPPPKYAGPPIPGPSDWPSAPVKEFLSEFKGTEIGWLVSAPKTILSNFSENSSIRMPDNTPECKGVIELRAFSLKSLPAGYRDDTIKKFYDQKTNMESQPATAGVVKKNAHGFQVRVYKTGAATLERTYTAIETEAHMIYLFLEVNYGKPENHDACIKTHMPVYQRISDFIRPG